VRGEGGERPYPSNLSSENLEGLTETFGNFGLRATSKNRCGAAKKRAGRARLAEAPSGGLWRWPSSVCSRRSATNFAEARYIRGPVG